MTVAVAIVVVAAAVAVATVIKTATRQCSRGRTCLWRVTLRVTLLVAPLARPRILLRR